MAVKVVPVPPELCGAYTHGEELVHYLSHGIGIVLSLAGIASLAHASTACNEAWCAVGSATFGTSALLMFTTSTLYHAARKPQTKGVLRTLDHCAIYLLIAGTYTPFMIGVLRGTWGWTLFSLIWVAAVLGIIAKVSFGHRFPKLSTLFYLAMGWMVVIAAPSLMARLTHAEAGWLLAGGVAYTMGVPFYVWKARRYAHALWHLFVMAGVACHFVAVLAVIEGAATGGHPHKPIALRGIESDQPGWAGEPPVDRPLP